LKKLGKYEILGELGHGAMGVVYRARDPIINRLVALKTITTGVADDPALLQRFYREAQSAGGLQHPNIVTIYDMGEAGALPYIAMELVEGENLEQLIARRSTFPLTLKLAYAIQACRAFDFAHKRGIVHRDIKPGNVMVGKDGTIKVVDFGIARVLETSRTQTGMLIGTFAYMSPEQYHGEHADERSDIWSFGVLFYELLTYAKPFAGPTPASLMHNICNVEPASLSAALPECPKDLEASVLKMLRKSPSERYQSMEDVLLDLEPIWKTLQSQSVSDLLEQTRQLFDEKRFAEARDLARQIVQLDSSNQHARTLLEKANSELKRALNRPKAQQFVERGQAFLGEGKLQEAKVAAEHALQLDSSFIPAEELQREIQKEMDRARLISEWLDAAKQHLAEGLPDEAEILLNKVLQEEPSNRQGQNLLQQASKEKAEREKARLLFQGLQRARELWTQQNYVESLNLLRELGDQFPGEEEVSRLFETVRDDQIEQQKRQSLLQSRNLVASGRHDDAINLLVDLRKQFPNDEAIPGLLEDVRKDQRNQRRMQGLAEARGLLAAGNYDSCISLLTSLKRNFPDEQEIPRLLETAQQNQAEQLRQQGITEAGKLLAARQYKECSAFLANLEKEFPGDKEILGLQKSVQEEQVAQERRQRIEEVRSLLAARRFDDCAALLVTLEKRFPADEELLSLKNALARDRSTQKRLQGLEEARNFLASKNFEKSLTALASIQQEFPDDDEVRRLLESTRKEQSEQRKQEELTKVRNLLAARRYDETIALLAKLESEFPGETSITKLSESARKEQADQRLRDELTQARNLLAARHYDDTIALLTKLQAEFPREAGIGKLLESARKEQAEQHRRDGLAQARNLLAARHFDECIALLTKLQMDFPGESEIAKLLATAREQLAEQRKELKLADARSLLAARSFTEALTVLNGLAASHPKDSAVIKLRALVQREQEKHTKEERLQRELEALKKLMGESKYPEVIARAKTLLSEYPAEPNLVRLAEFASGRQANIEKEQLFKQKLEEAKTSFDAGRFDVAMRIAQDALKTFPGNPEFQTLYQQSEIQQKKLLVRQQIEHRIREIRVKINREELSEAVDLAQQTLLTLGPDTDLTHLLNSAQVELQSREKKRLQEGTLETIRTLIDSGDLDRADQTIEEVLESQTLDSFDPRIQRLSAQIKEKRAESGVKPTVAAPHSIPGLSKEYAFLQATPLPEAPPLSEKNPPQDSAVTSAQQPANTTSVPQHATSGKPAESAPASELALPIAAEPKIAREAHALPINVQSRPAAVDLPSQVTSRSDVPSPSVRSWRRPAIIAVASLIILAAAWVGLRYKGIKQTQIVEPVTKTNAIQQPSAPTIDPVEVQQRQALNAANDKIAANDLDGALQLLQPAAALNGPLTSEIQKKLGQLEESKRDENLRQIRQGEEVLWQKASRLAADGRFTEAQKDLRQILAMPNGGVRRDDAQRYLDKIIPQLKAQSSLSAQAHQALQQGDFQTARHAAEQFKLNGGDPTELTAGIDRAEEIQLKQLESQFDQLKSRDDDASIQQLKSLQPRFQSLVDGGPQSNEAQNYANNISGTIADVRARIERKAADAAFQQMVLRYHQASASNDKNGLTTAKNDFQSVIQTGGPHAADAQKLLTEANDKLAALNQLQPPPPVAKPPAKPETSSPVVNPEVAVRAAIQRYAQAFNQRDADALRRVWPNMGPLYARYKTLFQQVSSISMTVDVEKIQFGGDGTTAIVNAQEVQESKMNGYKSGRKQTARTFQLSRSNGAWVITDVQ
jgi:eukaryotic-like serine/threonine-protein kinase